MPFQIIRADITKMKVDAIVNAANESWLGGGGVDGAIHHAAGPGLLEECRKLGGCRTGEAKITYGYALPANYVIHTVGPVWKHGNEEEIELLRSCYLHSMKLAIDRELESIAFPLISSGAYGCPKETAMSIAVETIGAFVRQYDLMVYLVIFDKEALRIGSKWFADLQSYIDDRYAEERSARNGRRRNLFKRKDKKAPDLQEPTFGTSYSMALPPEWGKEESVETSDEAGEYREETTSFHELQQNQPVFRPDAAAQPMAMPSMSYGSVPDSLEEQLKRLDEGFSTRLLRMIDEKGMTDAECYKKANIDRKHFSKIRSNPNYKPSKATVMAFCIALELSLKESKSFLESAGYAFSPASKGDLIVEYFIKKRNYDIFTINEALFAYDQTLLGNM